jgi:geranylgeranyl diphosphate synthase type I
MRELRAPEQVEELIDHRVEEALGHLRGLTMPAPARRALTDLARTVTDRDH